MLRTSIQYLNTATDIIAENCTQLQRPLNIIINQLEKIMKKRYRDESKRHESRESKSEERRETAMEKRGYKETESGRMVKSSPRRSLLSK